jgi:ubiquinone/menaquinone biosynthesis C-methylase UbiE
LKSENLTALAEMEETAGIQENRVSEAFTRQSPRFDALDRRDSIIQWMRERVRAHVLKTHPAGTMLELNCGTGLDAVFFAEHGFEVLATDNAPGMLEELERKLAGTALKARVTSQRCSFNDLEGLKPLTFDHVFSNFGGLNCAGDLGAVITNLKPLIKTGGLVTLVLMPRVCPWEMLMAVKGNFRLAGRRFKRAGADSNVEGIQFKTWYYSPAYVKRAFGDGFTTLAHFGLAALHPPPYMENFPKRFPVWSGRLKKLDERMAHARPFRSWADHYLITLKKHT